MIGPPVIFLTISDKEKFHSPCAVETYIFFFFLCYYSFWVSIFERRNNQRRLLFTIFQNNKRLATISTSQGEQCNFETQINLRSTSPRENPFPRTINNVRESPLSRDLKTKFFSTSSE
uniref:Uncharacterized protein n=1 Tax=Nelumbo nucifera TaxID=4432 RepID=A0A822YYN8_NELNU|nr:TPA_asm: hypothetical protein HUJ06_007030 [Nelumbo nucifera]